MEDYIQISEELLGAFLEGKTDAVESMHVLDVISNNEDIANIVNESAVLDEIDIISLRDGDYGYWELGIDPIFTTEELVSDSIDWIGGTIDKSWNIFGKSQYDEKSKLDNINQFSYSDSTITSLSCAEGATMEVCEDISEDLFDDDSETNFEDESSHFDNDDFVDDDLDTNESIDITDINI